MPRSSRFLMTALVLAALSAPADAAPLGPRLRYLRHLVGSGRMAAPERVAVSLLVEPELRRALDLPSALEPRLGRDGGVLRTAGVVPVLLRIDPADPAAAFAALERLAGVVLAETSWFPRSPPPPLDLSRPEIETPLVWPERDAQGVPLTGTGVVIADLDSGVDVFHPNFFRPDGGRYRWLDVDASGGLTPGVDAVDLDGDAAADPDETLRVLESALGAGYPAPNPPGYDIDIDWLFADTDGDARRDLGRGAGFSDATPGFGEPLLVADDADGDSVLDPGEELMRLGSSKIRAVRERAGTVRRRGVDLIDTEPDTYAPHGTMVCGILAGGIAGLSRFAGQAPDAELVVAGMYYPSVPPFEDDMASLALWARDEGARVFLYESGNWVWAWLDGSHPGEVTMSDLAAEGYLQLTPAGNLAGGRQQQTTTFTGGVPGTLALDSTGGARNVVWPSLLWRGGTADASVTLELPGPLTLTPCYCASTETIGGFTVYSDRTVSPRGTVMLNYEIRAAGGGPVTGTWTFHVSAARDLEVLAYSWDDASGWSSNTSVWTQADSTHCVTQPATGDRSIALAAYRPRGGSAGQLNSFSGRGTRIDGVNVLDLATPGSTVYSTIPKEFGEAAIDGFGGTSSALPHAAGAAALLVQLNPGDPHDVIERILRQSAIADGFTGPVPNTDWGMGKLRLRRAWEIASKPSLLRDDRTTSLAAVPAAKPSLLPLRLAGPSGYSREGEGPALSPPGSTDADAFLLAHIDPSTLDPEGPSILSDPTRPLVFYQLTGPAVLKLRKDASGLRLEY